MSVPTRAGREQRDSDGRAARNVRGYTYLTLVTGWWEIEERTESRCPHPSISPEGDGSRQDECAGLPETENRANTAKVHGLTTDWLTPAVVASNVIQTPGMAVAAALQGAEAESIRPSLDAVRGVLCSICSVTS